MKVVFLESIEGTAIVGDVKEVKNGFARNFLLPRGLAAPAKEPYLARAKAGAVREAVKQQALDKNASVIAEKLEGQKISMIARVGEQGKLYGSITSIHIAEQIAKLLGEDAEFDHRKVLLPEAIKELERCVKDLGMRAFLMPTNWNGIDMADPYWWNFWDRVRELGITGIIVHIGSLAGPWVGKERL